MLLLLLLMLMVALVVVSTVGTVRNGRLAGNRDSGVALLLRWGSIVGCRWIHGGVCLGWTWEEREITLIHHD